MQRLCLEKRAEGERPFRLFVLADGNPKPVTETFCTNIGEVVSHLIDGGTKGGPYYPRISYFGALNRQDCAIVDAIMLGLTKQWGVYWGGC